MLSVLLNSGGVGRRRRGFSANSSGDRFGLPSAFGCTLELRLARGELRSGSSGEEWPGRDVMLACEEERVGKPGPAS